MVEPGTPASDGELAAALATTGYTYTDPVSDDAYPRIVEAIELDEFPPGWGEHPTERDQAAIDGGGD